MKHGCKALRFQRPANIRSAAVLPDNSPADRLASVFIPHQSGFPLMGKADALHIARACAGLHHRLSTAAQHRLPDISRLGLYPAIIWVMLLEFFLAAGDD